MQTNTVSGNQKHAADARPSELQVFYLTNGHGDWLLPTSSMHDEPLPGSIVMTEGWFGTAWQRHFSDGLWHRTGGGAPKRWAYFLGKRNVILMYDADERGER